MQESVPEAPPLRVHTATKSVAFHMLILMALALAAPLACSCGYRVASSVKPLPQGITSLGVPTFTNLSQSYRLEQQVTRAVLAELNARTRMRVGSSASDADAVLYGEIRSMNSSPVAFGADTFGSAYLVTVQAAVKLVRRSNGKVLWENSDFLFRERYVLDIKVTEFFSEQNPALERLARDLAGSLVSTILNQ